MRSSDVTLAEVANQQGLSEAGAERVHSLVERVRSDEELPLKWRRDAVVRALSSLAGLAVPHVRAAASIADIGTGAGFPGLVLAAALPQARVALIEHRRGRAAFLTRVIAELEIENATLVDISVELWAEGCDQFDVTTSKGVSTPNTIVEWSAPLLRLGGIAVVWASDRRLDEEADAAVAATATGLRPRGVVREPKELGEKWRFHLFEKVLPTPTGFPRKRGSALHHPIRSRGDPSWWEGAAQWRREQEVRRAREEAPSHDRGEGIASAVALIPARAGSQRVPGKNVRPLAGHPLIAYSIAAARESGLFEAVVVSTDDEATAELGRRYGAEARELRPASMATSTSPDIEWVRRSIELLEAADRRPDLFAILRPTSPFRGAETIRRAWDTLLAHGDGADSIRAVELCRQHPGKMWRIAGGLMTPVLDQPAGVPLHSTQYAALPEVYVQNSSLEIAWTRVVEEHGEIAGPRVLPFLTNAAEGFSIDYPQDWEAAERMVARGEAALPTITPPAAR